MPTFMNHFHDSIVSSGFSIGHQLCLGENSATAESHSEVNPLLNNQEDYYYDYIIITNEELKSAFEPLLRWKRAKGCVGAIVTTEEINRFSRAKDLPAKIKDYLKNGLRCGNLKYVLLGGDDTVVPVRYCSGNFYFKAPETDREIPADLYYACINDPYDWDRNGNGVYGEPEDFIRMAPSFAVTRVPVNAKWAAKAYVDKVIEYERTPKWNNRFLLWGNILDLESNTSASLKGNCFYKEYIEKYKAFDKEELFDDSNTLGYPIINCINVDTLIHEIRKGYNFISAVTHGTQTSWRIGTKVVDKNIVHDVYFTANAGGHINDDCHTIITTMACQTNAFDITDTLNSEASLSEMFIRNAYSGVVAYLGCSRNSWFRLFNGVDPSRSLGYEGEFYKYLLDGNTTNSFGPVVQAAKANQLKYVLNDSKDLCRAIMLGLNPLGDPEMPIFTEQPHIFNGISAVCDGRSIDISVGEVNCRICIRGLGSETSYCNLFENRASVSASDLPDQFSVCITKQNFVPWTYGFNRQPDGSYRMTELSYEDLLQDNFGLVPIKGQIISIKNVDDGIFIPVNRTCEISTLVSSSANSAYLLVTKLNGNTVVSTQRYDIKQGESSTAITVSGISSLSNMTVVDLIVDGVSQETIKVY